ncbi:MAG TPA: glycosyltransferase family 2 protein [Kiritimatiellia bacterium]|jgi:hypothetical protein|nr:MAG: N-acetylglucosaminyl-diphospho-decaprenol L-rhamnosyltransferase [Verrucomicrobia bacterium ADurb.Bin018]HOE36284.1 glycosyltransferase family 2 protein [Kiritimatiellia bacterium]HOR73704.1 glycosyltransferase family 2 protein [Kiritimatiellia bacterium]HOU58291.1 glycosyltransferase family 2 protein [Kiritimatiellia bacterium]HPK68741.1 glycosyltransferase family 2 protein [Kiritimatiellia bacterium]
MNSPAPKVGIALLNWNQYDDTALCLTSIRESAYPPAITMVYDNGSEDGSPDRLKQDFPEIQLVRGEKNYGYSEGNNRAVKILLDAEMDYIWVLNNDTKVPPDCLGTLVQVLQDDPEIGAVSSKIWFMDESKPLYYAGGTFNRWTFDTQYHGLREKDVGQYDQPQDTEIFSGCCMLIRADVLRRIGLFNKAFFIYAEDIEWSVRALEMGIRQRYEPRATLWHKMYGSSVKSGKREVPKSSPRVEFLLARNRFILVRLHTRPWSIRRFFALSYHIFIRGIPRGLALLLKKDRRAAGLARLKGLWAGLWLIPDPKDCLL